MQKFPHNVYAQKAVTTGRKESRKLLLVKIIIFVLNPKEVGKIGTFGKCGWKKAIYGVGGNEVEKNRGWMSMYRVRRGLKIIYLLAFYTLRSIHIPTMCKFIYILWAMLSSPLYSSFVSWEEVIFVAVMELTRLTSIYIKA